MCHLEKMSLIAHYELEMMRRVLSDLKQVDPKLRCFWFSVTAASCTFLPRHPGSAEASQVQREVPEQTPECPACGS